MSTIQTPRYPITKDHLYRVALWAATQGFMGRTHIDMTDVDEKVLILDAKTPTVDATDTPDVQDADVSRR